MVDTFTAKWYIHTPARWTMRSLAGYAGAGRLTECSTASAEPFCNTVSFPGEIYDFYCNSLSISTPQLALTTYDGETDGRAFLTTVLNDGSSELPSTSSRTRPSTSGTDSSSSTTSTASVRTSSTSTSTPAPTGNGGSSTPTGAIVGGVVGGIAVLGLTGLGIILILRRRGASPPPTPPLTGLAPQSQNQPPPTTPGTHQSFYVPPPNDPTKHNSAVMVTGQPMTQAYTTPPPPPFPAQPYSGQPLGVQGGYPQGVHGTVPVSAGEYDVVGTAGPVSPSTTAAHQSYQPVYGQGAVHEIGGGGHRGTLSELG